MKKMTKSLSHIFNWNSLLVIVISIIGTYICVKNEWKMNFPMTIIGIAVVFPIVFSIGWAYKRRETALVYYWNIKSYSRVIYFASRDWLRDKWKLADKNKNDFKLILRKILHLMRKLFQEENKQKQDIIEKELYVSFSKFSKIIEWLRDRWLSSWEISRINSHLTKLISSFENFKHIFQYRTPKTLRTYSKVFIFIIPVIYSPYFAHIADWKPLFFAFVMPILFALIFTSLDNIQDHLENPFDQKWEDDIKINVDKFIKTLDL